MVRCTGVLMIAVALGACDDVCLTDPGARRLAGSQTIPAADFEAGAMLVGGLTDVTIDNYTPNAFEFDADNTFKYRRPDGGRFRVDDLGGLIPGAPDVTFTVEPTRREPYTIYLDDMRAETVSYSAAPGRFIVDLAFESEGTEVFSNCIENIICVGDPNMHLNNATLRLDLIVGSGDQLVQRVEATFDADIENAEGVCKDNFFAFLCDIFAPDDDSVRQQVSDAVATAINGNPELLASLDDGVRAILETLTDLPEQAEITGVLISGTRDIEVLYDLPCSLLGG